MKLNDLTEYLHNIGPNDIEIDFSQWIVNDEFYNRRGDHKTDYRLRAIDRLVKSGLPWHTEGNIDHDVAKKFIEIICPYCGGVMHVTTGSGVAGRSTASYRCSTCGSEASLTFLDVSFSPGKK